MKDAHAAAQALDPKRIGLDERHNRLLIRCIDDPKPATWWFVLANAKGTGHPNQILMLVKPCEVCRKKSVANFQHGGIVVEDHGE